MAWKNQIYKNKIKVSESKAIVPPCKCKVTFEKRGTEWKLKEVNGDHNHEPDPTLLSNEIIFYIDEIVTSRGCNISSVEVLNMLKA